MITTSIPTYPGISQITVSSYNPTKTMNHICEADIDCQSLANRIYYFVQSWIREIICLVKTCYLTATEKIFGAPLEYVEPSAMNNRWRKENKGLYIAIHGLRGRPNIWSNQLVTLRKKQPGYEIRVPFVPKGGNCPLSEAVEPIEAMIRSYITEHPDKPVCLLGVSNGARIAAELEVRLRDTKTPVKISCIAGVLSGTKRLHDVYWLAKIIYTTPLIDELLYQSRTVLHLLNRMRGQLPYGVERSYDFYASPNDIQIKPYTGSFPILSHKDVKYYVVHGENHGSIASRVSDIQTKRCMDWMESATLKQESLFHGDSSILTASISYYTQGLL